MYAVILAGGGGTRLWPLSSPECPKPFLPLLGDRTLLQLTADRLDGVVEPGSIHVVTDQRYERLVKAQLPDAKVLAEPVGRNTGPAIAYATVAIRKRSDEVMVVLPADQIIGDEDQFRSVLRHAEIELAKGSLVQEPLVTLGIEMARAATEYGYLVPDLSRSQQRDLTAYVLEAFEEKPSIERATQLWQQGGGVAWNAGIFMWQRGAIRKALTRFAPLVFGPIEEGFRLGSINLAYQLVPSISIDYAVMQEAARQRQVVMGAMNVGWNDLGSWTSLLGELGMPGIGATIAPAGEPFEAGAEDLAVWRSASGRLASASGVDATMVETTGPVAILRGAHEHKARIDDLLARCSTPEAPQ